MIQQAALNDLRASLHGSVLTPADAGHDEVRRLHNGMFLGRPAVIDRCLVPAPPVCAVTTYVRFPAKVSASHFRPILVEERPPFCATVRAPSGDSVKQRGVVRRRILCR